MWFKFNEFCASLSCYRLSQEWQSSHNRVFWLITMKKLRKRRSLLRSTRLTCKICSWVWVKKSLQHPKRHSMVRTITMSRSTQETHRMEILLPTWAIKRLSLLRTKWKKSQDSWPHLCRSLGRKRTHQTERVLLWSLGRSSQLPTTRTWTKKTIQISSQTTLRRAFKSKKLESSLLKMAVSQLIRKPMKRTRQPWVRPAQRSSNRLQPKMNRRLRKRRESARRTGSRSRCEQVVWLMTHEILPPNSIISDPNIS